LLIKLNLATPAIHTFRDFVVSSAVVIDRALEQQLGLSLRRHLIEDPGLMLGKDIRRGWLGLTVETDES